MASTFNGQSLNLKYLFTAYFEDGHVIRQDASDKSLVDPEGKKSLFFDVLEYEKTSKLIRFELQTASKFSFINPSHFASINLKTGKFTVNGLEIESGDQYFEPTEPLRIVYFRETRVEQDISQKDGKMAGQRFYVNRYFLGFQTNWKNKNYQCTIALS